MPHYRIYFLLCNVVFELQEKQTYGRETQGMKRILLAEGMVRNKMSLGHVG